MPVSRTAELLRIADRSDQWGKVLPVTGYVTIANRFPSLSLNIHICNGDGLEQVISRSLSLSKILWLYQVSRMISHPSYEDPFRRLPPWVAWAKEDVCQVTRAYSETDAFIGHLLCTRYQGFLLSRNTHFSEGSRPQSVVKHILSQDILITGVSTGCYGNREKEYVTQPGGGTLGILRKASWRR